MQLRFTSFAVINLRRDLYPQECAHAGRTKKNARSIDRAFLYNSLTMSYFHTGIRTIIGAEAFHCPVRDGKEWYHLAMVVRHNFLPSRHSQDNEFIELISMQLLPHFFDCVTWHNNFE